MDTQRCIWRILLIGYIFLAQGCTDFVETELPPSQLTGQAVFSDRATATAALANIYAGLRDKTPFTGSSRGISNVLGHYADELDYYGDGIGSIYNFSTHSILATEPDITKLWNNSYNLIYSCNSLLEGMEDNATIEKKDRDQLRGEALFLRSFIHFYLAQLFGDIPYIAKTDYHENSKIGKMEIAKVYEQLASDLELAIDLLSEDYVVPGRIRVNQFVAMAFLARVQLYAGNWHASQSLCNNVLAQTGLYIWDEDLTKVFLKEASGTLWQLRPASNAGNSLEAINFIFETGPPPSGALSQSLIDSFTSEDQRRLHWTKSVTDDTNTWNHPYKYKESGPTDSSLEHSILIRLAEVYLIRAEAKMYLNDFYGAMADLNKIRKRAGLFELVGLDRSGLETAILNERRHEFFTEFGHRWFDLKRFHRAGEVLTPLKPNWRDSDLLFPIPQTELLANPNLIPQNDGY